MSNVSLRLQRRDNQPPNSDASLTVGRSGCSRRTRMSQWGVRSLRVPKAFSLVCKASSSLTPVLMVFDMAFFSRFGIKSYSLQPKWPQGVVRNEPFESLSFRTLPTRFALLFLIFLLFSLTNALCSSLLICFPVRRRKSSYPQARSVCLPFSVNF